MLVRLRLRNNLLPTFKKQPHYVVKEWRWCDGKKGKNTEQLFLETDNPFISNIFLSFESSIQRSLDIETKSFPGFSITRPYGTRERKREEKEKILGTRFNIRACYPQLIKCVTSLLLSPVCLACIKLPLTLLLKPPAYSWVTFALLLVMTSSQNFWTWSRRIPWR